MASDSELDSSVPDFHTDDEGSDNDERRPVARVTTTESAPVEETSPKRRNRKMDVTADFRRTHGVQFQRQLENLKSAGGSLRFGKNSLPGSLNAHENSDSEVSQEDDEDRNTELSAFEKFIDAWQYFRYRCGLIANDKNVQLFMVYLIALNGIMMGIGTFSFVKDDPEVEDMFELIDLVFLIIFTLEFGTQFVFYGWRLIQDGWLVFDLIIITLSWAFSQVQIIRAFRIFRAFRLITRIKVLKNLVLALFGVVPRMFAIGILLLLVSYIFAVMFTQLFKDLYERGLTDEDYFGRMDRTFFTLFQIMTLDAWADIARQVMDVYSWAWIPFIFFVIATGFVVVNLIIAVICDAISALHDDEKAKLHGTYEENSQDESSEVKSSESEKEESIEDDEDEYNLEADVRYQLDSLEKHVEELARMQEDALMTLEMLTQHIAERKVAVVPASPPGDNSESSQPVSDRRNSVMPPPPPLGDDESSEEEN